MSTSNLGPWRISARTHETYKQTDTQTIFLLSLCRVPRFALEKDICNVFVLVAFSHLNGTVESTATYLPRPVAGATAKYPTCQGRLDIVRVEKKSLQKELTIKVCSKCCRMKSSILHIIVAFPVSAGDTKFDGA